MTMRRYLEWLLIALTAGLLISLKRLHYGVTHYNIFLLILLAWTLVMIVTLRILREKRNHSIDQNES